MLDKESTPKIITAFILNLFIKSIKVKTTY